MAANPNHEHDVEMHALLKSIDEHVQNLQRCRHLLPSGECALYAELQTEKDRAQRQIGELHDKLNAQSSLMNRFIGAGSILGFLIGTLGAWIMGLFGHRP